LIVRWLRRRRIALLIGALLSAAAFWTMERDPGALLRRGRERAFDILGTAFPRVSRTNRVVVIDIDRAALGENGTWPWPRDKLAALVESVAAGHPAVIAIDMLLTDASGSAAASPADQRLAEALRRVPSVLGALFDPDAVDTDFEGPPIGVTGPIDAPEMLRAPGVDGPSALFRGSAAGTGILSLAAPDGEPVRKVPLLAQAGWTVVDGLAVEAIRVAQGDVTLIVNPAQKHLRIGASSVPLGTDASLRLHFASPEHRNSRTVSAASVMANTAAANFLRGKIAFIGAGAPEAGGLRRTAADAFMPSVQIQADAAEQMLDSAYLSRPAGVDVAERIVLAALSAAAVLAAILLGPLWATLLVGTLIAGWIAGVVFAFARDGMLMDPVAPSLFAGLIFQGTSLASFAGALRERRAIEIRFAKHLSPVLVSRIVQHPESLRLQGEERTVTALFTDIEKFTALTERTPPQRLIALLNVYLDRVTSIVVEHGGLVDKIVGDAVYALFNAPIDLKDHAQQAIRCAIAILAATETLRREPEIAELGLGRTRIGIETGRAVVGDVGGTRKLDYTAYGSAINTAAKLEVANKSFGSSIAVGPSAVAACREIAFRPLGQIQPSAESEPLLACEPWPAATDDDLAAYMRAYQSTQSDPAQAIELFTQLSVRHPDDGVLACWIRRLVSARRPSA